jgi:hypothetical protein
MSEVNKADSSGKRQYLNARVRELLKEGFSPEETQELSGASMSYVTQIIWGDANPERYEEYRAKHRAACKKRRLRYKRRAHAAEMRQKKAELRAAKVEESPVKTPTLIANAQVDMFLPIIEQMKPTIMALAHAIDTDPPPAVDMVNSPAHYVKGGIETIDFIKAKLTHEQYIGYLRGNVLKYSSRLGEKGNISEDAGKLAWYSRELADALKEHA